MGGAMLRIRLLGERIRLDRSRDEARIGAVLVGLIAWLFLAILACDGNASVAAYAGLIATVGALAIAVVTNLLLRAHVIMPLQLHRAVAGALDVHDALMSEQSRFFRLIIYVALIPLGIGLVTWAMAFVLVWLLALSFSWKMDELNPHHALVCFVMAWVGLSVIVVGLCQKFGTDRILNPKFWRAMDYPWVMTTAVTIVISVQREGATWEWDLSTADRWRWYLILSVLVAFRLTRTTAEVVRELPAFKSRLEPVMSPDVLRDLNRETARALQEWIESRRAAEKQEPS
jgi:hypothetical protein